MQPVCRVHLLGINNGWISLAGLTDARRKKALKAIILKEFFIEESSMRNLQRGIYKEVPWRAFAQASVSLSRFEVSSDEKMNTEVRHVSVV